MSGPVGAELDERILKGIIAGGPISAFRLAQKLGVPRPRISARLQILRRAGKVVHAGAWDITGDPLALIADLSGVSYRLAETYLTAADAKAEQLASIKIGGAHGTAAWSTFSTLLYQARQRGSLPKRTVVS